MVIVFVLVLFILVLVVLLLVLVVAVVVLVCAVVVCLFIAIHCDFNLALTRKSRSCRGTFARANQADRSMNLLHCAQRSTL